MTTRKNLLACLILFIAITAFVGCGGATSSTTEGQAGVPTPKQAEKEKKK